MTKALIPTKCLKKAKREHKTQANNSITHHLQTDLGRSLGQTCQLSIRTQIKNISMNINLLIDTIDEQPKLQAGMS